MIRQVEIDDRSLPVAREVTKALGFLDQAPKGGIVITAANGSVTIDSSKLVAVLDFVRGLVQAELDPSAEVSPQEAAKRLRMSRPTVMRLIADGKIGARRVGSHYRLSEAEVMDFKANQATIRRKGLDNLAAFSQDYDQ